ncbi:hypothetical protein HDU91_007092, partial [Kappamyces sp. JEL0680]
SRSTFTFWRNQYFISLIVICWFVFPSILYKFGSELVSRFQSSKTKDKLHLSKIRRLHASILETCVGLVLNGVLSMLYLVLQEVFAASPQTLWICMVTTTSINWVADSLVLLPMLTPVFFKRGTRNLGRRAKSTVQHSP